MGLALGLFLGYWAARWCGLGERVCRTIALEVGMQNSGLAVALAQHYFAVISALPGALFSIWHNITGSILAWHWNGRSLEEDSEEKIPVRTQSP